MKKQYQSCLTTLHDINDTIEFLRNRIHERFVKKQFFLAHSDLVSLLHLILQGGKGAFETVESTATTATKGGGGGGDMDQMHLDMMMQVLLGNKAYLGSETIDWKEFLQLCLVNEQWLLVVHCCNAILSLQEEKEQDREKFRKIRDRAAENICLLTGEKPVLPRKRLRMTTDGFPVVQQTIHQLLLQSEWNETLKESGQVLLKPVVQANGSERLGVFATVDMEAGEQVFMDRMIWFTTRHEKQCYWCGSFPGDTKEKKKTTKKKPHKKKPGMSSGGGGGGGGGSLLFTCDGPCKELKYCSASCRNQSQNSNHHGICSEGFAQFRRNKHMTGYGRSQMDLLMELVGYLAHQNLDVTMEDCLSQNLVWQYFLSQIQQLTKSAAALPMEISRRILHMDWEDLESIHQCVQKLVSFASSSSSPPPWQNVVRFSMETVMTMLMLVKNYSFGFQGMTGIASVASIATHRHNEDANCILTICRRSILVQSLCTIKKGDEIKISSDSYLGVSTRDSKE